MSADNAEVVPNICIQEQPIVNQGANGKKKKTSLAKQLEQAQDHPALLYLPPKDGESRQTISPTVISAQVLKTLFQAVENETHQTVSRAVVGVPAYFNDAQREATIQACNLAGVIKVKALA